jgi:hypothetical protein
MSVCQMLQTLVCHYPTNVASDYWHFNNTICTNKNDISENLHCRCVAASTFWTSSSTAYSSILLDR